MSARSAMTVVTGTVISSAWGNLVRDHIVSRTTASDVTAEGMLSAQTTANTFEVYTGAAVETFGGYGAWTSYTPTVADSVGGGSAFTKGNGTVTGQYRYVGGRAVAFEATFTFGTTSGYGGGAGQLLLSVPVNIASGYVQVPGRIVDVSASTGYVAIGRYYSATQVSLWVGAAAGSYVTDTAVVGSGTPVTFASGDAVSLTGVYETTA